jgi:hypothetical protein
MDYQRLRGADYATVTDAQAVAEAVGGSQFVAGGGYSIAVLSAQTRCNR